MKYLSDLFHLFPWFALLSLTVERIEAFNNLNGSMMLLFLSQLSIILNLHKHTIYDKNIDVDVLHTQN